MKVKIIKTGKTEDVSESYGSRLIEQGKAVLFTEKVTADKTAHTRKAE